MIDPAKASEYPCPLKHDVCQGDRCPVWRVTSTAIMEEARPGNLAAITDTAPRMMEVKRFFGFCGLSTRPFGPRVLHG